MDLCKSRSWNAPLVRKAIMEAKWNPTCGEGDLKCSPQQFESDLLRTIVSASLLAAVCAYLFKRLRGTEQRLPVNGIAQANDVETPDDDVLCQLDKPKPGQISAMLFLADGKRIVCAYKAEKTIQIWNIEDQTAEPLTRNDVAVNVITSSKDGKWIITGDTGGKVTVWDTNLERRYEAAEQHGRMVTALDVSSHVASGSNNGTVRIWKMGELGSPLLLGPLMHHSDSISISSVKFSPAGSHLASACAHWNYYVKIWHSQTGEQIESIRIDSSPIYSLAWTSDGRRLFAGCSNGLISCFDTIARRPLKIVQPRAGDDSVTSLRISNGDQFLISFSSYGRTIDIWDIRDTPTQQPLRSYSRCVSASLSLDDLYLASSGTDTKVTVRKLSEIIEPSYFLCHFTPSQSDSQPFMCISPTAYQAWKSGELEQVEEILSREIEEKRYKDLDRHALANRAFIRTRLGNFDGALDDAAKVMTNKTHVPPMAQIAKAVALLRAEKESDAMDAFPTHFNDAHIFVECVKSVFLFEAQFRRKLDSGSDLVEPDSLGNNPWVEAYRLLLFAEHFIHRKQYDEGLRLLERVPDLSPLRYVPEAKIIALIFGWDIGDLECMVQQLQYLTLFASGRTQEVVGFRQISKHYVDEENEARKGYLGWLGEKLGDESLCHKKYINAIVWYSESLRCYPRSRVVDQGSKFASEWFSELKTADDAGDGAITQDLALIGRYPPSSARLFVKRGKARVFEKSWDYTLRDAGLAIDADRSWAWGYEIRYVALHALQRYEDAVNALREMFTKMEGSTDPSTDELRTRYVAPTETIRKIDKQIDDICKMSPLVLIHVRSGHAKAGYLCDAIERTRIFKEDFIFHELVSSISTGLHIHRIQTVVERYFRYVMFSHTWEKTEPTFEDLSGKSVYDDANPDKLKPKLRPFCDTVRCDPEKYLWAWSDTCCIDKSIDAVYKTSIRSMYSWYKQSALTIVLLAEESSFLENDRWMTRAWTLQELLSPKRIRFYHRNWKPYQGDVHPNHKESHPIMQKLAKAIDIAEDTLVDFSPASLGIRTKLRLASTRQASVEVDIAYALLGIFDSHQVPEPHRDPEVALGLLLQEVVHREHEAKAVLDWTGTSSQFHSCLPAKISAYQQPLLPPPCISDDEMDARVEHVRARLPQEDVVKLSQTNSISFINQRLSLPCIVFPVSVEPTDRSSLAYDSNTVSYRVQAETLDQFEFDMTCPELGEGDEVVLVHPWVHDLLAKANVSHLDTYSRGLRLVVHLEQQFRALLLVKGSNEMLFRRVCAEKEILVPERQVRSLKDINMRMLEIR